MNNLKYHSFFLENKKTTHFFSKNIVALNKALIISKQDFSSQKLILNIKYTFENPLYFNKLA